jgi:hypothetical protein
LCHRQQRDGAVFLNGRFLDAVAIGAFKDPGIQGVFGIGGLIGEGTAIQAGVMHLALKLMF